VGSAGETCVDCQDRFDEFVADAASHHEHSNAFGGLGYLRGASKMSEVTFESLRGEIIKGVVAAPKDFSVSTAYAEYKVLGSKRALYIDFDSISGDFSNMAGSKILYARAFYDVDVAYSLTKRDEGGYATTLSTTLFILETAYEHAIIQCCLTSDGFDTSKPTIRYTKFL